MCALYVQAKKGVRVNGPEPNGSLEHYTTPCTWQSYICMTLESMLSDCQRTTARGCPEDVTSALGTSPWTYSTERIIAHTQSSWSLSKILFK